MPNTSELKNRQNLIQIWISELVPIHIWIKFRLFVLFNANPPRFRKDWALLNLESVRIENNPITRNSDLTPTERSIRSVYGNYTKTLQTQIDNSLKLDATKQQLYGHLPLISKMIRAQQSMKVGHCWRSKDELKSDVVWLLHYSVGQTIKNINILYIVYTFCVFILCTYVIYIYIYIRTWHNS